MFCKNLLFIFVEDHIIICAKEIKFSSYRNCIDIKYLQHFHLIEINKCRQYKIALWE